MFINVTRAKLISFRGVYVCDLVGWAALRWAGLGLGVDYQDDFSVDRS